MPNELLPNLPELPLQELQALPQVPVEPALPEAQLPIAAPTPRRKRRRRSYKIDKQAAVKLITEARDRVISERSEWMRKRLLRYPKIYGWTPEYLDKDGNLAPNVNPAIISVATLRLRATLENALKSSRPMVQAKAKQKRNQPKENTINQLQDFQVFVENDGERLIDDYVEGYVNDGTVISHQKWVKRTENIVQKRIVPLPGNPKLEDLSIESLRASLLESLPSLFPELVNATMVDNDGFTWNVDFIDDSKIAHEARVEFYEREDNLIEAYIRYDATVHDGPSIEVHDLEDILVPPRSANLQPRSPENPYGAPFVIRVCKMSLDDIIRGQRSGVYDLLSKSDLEKIKANADPIYNSQQDEMKVEKDMREGVLPTPESKSPDRIVLEFYGSVDIDGDGLEEEAIIWMTERSKVIMGAKYLTEIYPGIPVRRPFSEARLFPVANRFYGISLPELLEPIHDAVKRLLDQGLEWGEVTNHPNFFYRPMSGMLPEIIRLKSGEGYPLENPTTDVHYPTWNRDSSWVINFMTLISQQGEKLAMQSDVNFGRVPAGKSSALRNFSSISALLSQGDARTEQVLRRLFGGLTQIYGGIHRLNRHSLPDNKQFRVLGIPERGTDPYVTIHPEDLDFDVDYEFRASMLISNKEATSIALQEVAALVLSPIAIQMGIATPEKVHTLMRDIIKARDFDADRYTTRPTDEYAQKITAEEAFASVKAYEEPVGMPLEESAQAHFEKLQRFQASDGLAGIGGLTAGQLEIYAKYVKRVLQLTQREQQKEIMAQAASQFQNQIAQGQPTQQAVGGESVAANQMSQPADADVLASLEAGLPPAEGGV